MRWRIRKKRGLLKDPEYERIKERLFQELGRAWEQAVGPDGTRNVPEPGNEEKGGGSR